MTADFLGTLKLGEPQPLKAAFRGIEYPGEILLADAWRPELGEIDTAAAGFTELLRKAFA